MQRGKTAARRVMASAATVAALLWMVPGHASATGGHQAWAARDFGPGNDLSAGIALKQQTTKAIAAMTPTT